MTERERSLATIVFSVLGLGVVAFLFYLFYLGPLNEREQARQAAQDEVDKRMVQLVKAAHDRARLRRYQSLSLPSNVALARRAYQEYIDGLARKSGFPDGALLVTSKEPTAATFGFGRTKETPAYTTLTFTVHGHGSLKNLAKFMKGFYETGLLHTIRRFDIQRAEQTQATSAAPAARAGRGGAGGFPGQGRFRQGMNRSGIARFTANQNEVNVNLTIDALVVTGASARGRLLPNIDARVLLADAATGMAHGLSGLLLAAWAAGPTGPLGPAALTPHQRDYTAIAEKDPFFGRTPSPVVPRDDTDVTAFVYLTSITQNGSQWEAFLFDRVNNRRTRLRNRPGFQAFRVNNAQGETIVRAEVKAFQDRDLLIQSGSQFYAFHVGDNLHNALRHRLTADEVNSFLGKTPEVRKPTGETAPGLP